VLSYLLGENYMSTDTDLIIEKVRYLSVDDLLRVQATIRQELELKTTPKSQKPKRARFSDTPRKIVIPEAYQPSSADIEAELAQIFTAEELAEIAGTDISDIPVLPLGAKTSTELISEDREDRF
jgi:hypothetical protein